LFCDVPEYSILGPAHVYSVYHTIKLFYSQPPLNHSYVDETQVYISLSTSDTDLSLKQLADRLSDISGWMTNNRLRLNAIKTHFSITGTSRQRSKLTRFFPTPIINHSITPSDTVRNLGDTFHCNFNLRNRINLLLSYS